VGLVEGKVAAIVPAAQRSAARQKSSTPGYLARGTQCGRGNHDATIALFKTSTLHVVGRALHFVIRYVSYDLPVVFVCFMPTTRLPIMHNGAQSPLLEQTRYKTYPSRTVS